MAVSAAATLIVLALPPLLLGTRLPRKRGVLWFLLYFVCIGAGYILVEVALIQKFVLFLGHPTYALTVVIFSMLLSSGLGSFASKRLVRTQIGRLRSILMLILAAVLVLSAILPPIAEAGVSLPLPIKVLLSVALI